MVKRYRELRHETKRAIWKKQHELRYELFKQELLEKLDKFHSTDDLFNLVEAMRVGTKILLSEDFPTKEFMVYVNKEQNGEK